MRNSHNKNAIASSLQSHLRNNQQILSLGSQTVSKSVFKKKFR